VHGFSLIKVKELTSSEWVWAEFQNKLIGAIKNQTINFIGGMDVLQFIGVLRDSGIMRVPGFPLVRWIRRCFWRGEILKARGGLGIQALGHDETSAIAILGTGCITFVVEAVWFFPLCSFQQSG